LRINGSEQQLYIPGRRGKPPKIISAGIGKYIQSERRNAEIDDYHMKLNQYQSIPLLPSSQNRELSHIKHSPSHGQLPSIRLPRGYQSMGNNSNIPSPGSVNMERQRQASYNHIYNTHDRYNEFHKYIPGGYNLP
jgi:hypothetical protein